MSKKGKKVQLINGKTIHQFAKEILPGTNRGLEIKFPCDLRASLQMKLEEASKFGWTAFINNAGTLCHVVHHTDDVLIRATLPGVKEWRKEAVHQHVSMRMNNMFQL